ncbi:ABC-three component system middle component 6 [Grimontia sp. NTOU-MAR1]|uniref:ABC-three component system middle component 6 n=1 Tax=Grimontia sp. NTOU-MAR1 TaxID=3111011 RepID=UPI002DB8976C|nr:ABC-three component system middle component 6 [Grimontia sp. NTOU-MAR1]WRV96534.1 ABC-three component system middle component 6 [Grimontia sp. NTOU-MAR1]
MLTIDSDPIINPINIGAHILNLMSKNNDKPLNVEEIYDHISKELDISYEVFTFSLDWLYAIEAINLDDDGIIKYASK